MTTFPRRIARIDVPAFLDELDTFYGPLAAEVGARVLAAVGLLPLPRRTIRRSPAGGAPAGAVPSPEVLRDPAVPACVPFADVELEDLGGPAWTMLRASSAYGEASCRLACTFAHPMGSFACTGAGIGS